MSDTGFYEWWQKHYSMANLAMGAAEDAWNAATERAAKIADDYAKESWGMTEEESAAMNIAAAIRSGEQQ